MVMRRYLLVLDMDLLALDEELDLQPINHRRAGAVRRQVRPCSAGGKSIVMPGVKLPVAP
jgi:hypothetical protein